MLNKSVKAAIKLYIYHVFCVIASVLLFFPLFNLAQERPYIFSLITTLVYVLTLYSIIWPVGRADSRKIPGFYPDRRIPLVVTGITLIIPVLMLVFRIISHNGVSDGVYLSGVINGNLPFMFPDNYINGLADFILKIWFIPFEAFLQNNYFVAYLAVFLIKPIVIFLGYEAGIRRIQPDIKVFSKLIYKDK